ncbi:11446_t:CDS:2, partial [Scutellospora calospora]
MGKVLSRDREQKLNYTKIFKINNEEKLDRENERTSLRHNIVRVLFNGNFSAPVEDLLREGGAKVIDIGRCGHGTWICEMSSDFRKSHFYGTEIVSKVVPHLKPSNVTIVEADILRKLP